MAALTHLVMTLPDSQRNTPLTAEMMVAVAYALPERQVVATLRVAGGTSVDEAIRQSGILRQFPEIDLATCKVGIFGKSVPHDQLLNDGDRVEIYRPLLIDPKEARRQRAKGA